MQLDDLKHGCGQWLRGSGPEVDIVLSSRIRLARNLADFPFVSRASAHEKTELVRLLRGHVETARLRPDMTFVDIGPLSDLDCQMLVERHLISREHAASDGSRGVMFSDDENLSLMINEEDHLRIQVMRSGMDLMTAWEEIDAVDDSLDRQVNYAFHERLGYLTACPTNVGTGLRASVMLHLPALVITKQIEKVFRALAKINLAVRGLHGEGSQASGDFYQISNQVTLGKSETDLLETINGVIPQIIHYERTAREALVNEGRESLHDRVSRAFGILKTAQKISSEETMHLLSSVRMGVHLGLLDDLAIENVNSLFIQTQPAHLQRIQDRELESEERNVARAGYIRKRLGI
jgi:protein arginine kinase